MRSPTLNVLRHFLRALSAVAVCVLATACHSDRTPDGAVQARRSEVGIEFGIWEPGPDGDPRFIATLEVPRTAEQVYGWRLRARDPNRPVKWVETLRLPAPAQSWDGVEENPNVTVSEDGRTATTYGQSEPGDSYIGNVWGVSSDDPLGDYQLTVEFEDGRKEKITFHVVPGKDGGDDNGPGVMI